MSNIDHELQKLDEFRREAQEMQRKAGGTVEVVPERTINLGLHTTRFSTSLVLVDHDVESNRIALFKERVPGHPKESENRRLAVFGGGIRSHKEAEVAAEAAVDPDKHYPELCNAKGELLGKAYYNLLGKGLLRTGRLPEITYPRMSTGRMRGELNRELLHRLKTEIGDSATQITKPSYLRGMKPRTTHVMGRTVGDYTEDAASAYNLLLNDKGQIADMCISVRERFAWAYANLDCLAENNGAMRIFSLEEFIAFLEPQLTGNFDDWKERSDRSDESIRNDSTIYAVALTLGQTRTVTSKVMKRFIDWQLKRKVPPATAISV